MAETVIMKITGHRTRSVFERYNITDQTDTQEAGRKAEEFQAREREVVAQITSQNPRASIESRRINPLFCVWCGEGDLNPHGFSR